MSAPTLDRDPAGPDRALAVVRGEAAAQVATDDGQTLSQNVPSRLLGLRLDSECEPGASNLGAEGRPMALVAVVWILLSNGLFTLRQSSSVNHDDFDDAQLALAVVLLIATVWWSVSAQLQRTFQGPRSTVTPQHAVIDPDLM